MTSRSSDLQSDSDLDSIHDSCDVCVLWFCGFAGSVFLLWQPNCDLPLHLQVDFQLEETYIRKKSGSGIKSKIFRTRVYCGPVCQAKDWKGHQKEHVKQKKWSYVKQRKWENESTRNMKIGSHVKQSKRENYSTWNRHKYKKRKIGETDELRKFR